MRVATILEWAVLFFGGGTLIAVMLCGAASHTDPLPEVTKGDSLGSESKSA